MRVGRGSFAIVLCVSAVPINALADTLQERGVPTAETRHWRADIEAGYRVQGIAGYRGLYFAPGLWFEAFPGLEVGVLAPLHIRTSDEGRVGLSFSMGLEPRLRIAVEEALGIDLAVGFAAENHQDVEGVISYGVGLQVGEVMNLRYTRERYSFGPEFFSRGGQGDADANFLDIAFTGRAGQRLAYAEAALFVLIAAVTANAR